MGINSQIPLANTSLLLLLKFEVLENGRTKYIAFVIGYTCWSNLLDIKHKIYTSCV